MELPAAICAATSGAVRSVRVRPGCTTVTLMPEGPSSSAMVVVSAATATLRMLATATCTWAASVATSLSPRASAWSTRRSMAAPMQLEFAAESARLGFTRLAQVTYMPSYQHRDGVCRKSCQRLRQRSDELKTVFDQFTKYRSE
jgi:hypothetical protein